MRDGWTKWIIREAFRGIVPKEISDRVDKLGYMPPQQQWLNGLSWTDLMLDQLQKPERSRSPEFVLTTD